MVSSNCVNNNSGYMDSYKLLELSGSESENDVIHFAPYENTQPVGHPKKRRLKRKERDLLRSSGTYVNENSSSVNRCCGLCTFTEAEQQCCQDFSFFNSDGWEYFRSILLIVSIVGLTIITWLALHLQGRLDLMQVSLVNVEASGSELPAKFHESHVRLQQLEKNHTALWSTLITINSNLEDVTQKLKKLESSMKVIQESFSGSPQLSSLPKDVATIQDSVAAFGSSLQDVQSAVKAVKEENGAMQKKLDLAATSLSNIKNDVHDLYNATQLPTEGREGSDRTQLINEAFVNLKNRVNDLSSSVSTINGSVITQLSGANESKVQSMELRFNASVISLRGRLDAVEATCNTIEGQQVPSRINNMTVDLSILKDSSNRHYKLLQNLTQSLAVVKGVEKKLEGSQLQMASGVSELQKQLQSIENQLHSITTPSTKSPSEAAIHNRLQERSSSDQGSSNQPRRKRWLP